MEEESGPYTLYDFYKSQEEEDQINLQREVKMEEYEWATSINVNPYKGGRRGIVNLEGQERARRFLDSKNGIQHLGPI